MPIQNAAIYITTQAKSYRMSKIYLEGFNLNIIDSTNLLLIEHTKHNIHYKKLSSPALISHQQSISNNSTQQLCHIRSWLLGLITYQLHNMVEMLIHHIMGDRVPN